MSLNLREKYDIILDHERQFAYRLAKDVVKKPEVSVWMILLPVLFVHHMMKMTQYKEGIHTFAKNILGTKMKALDKALQDVETGEIQNYGPADYFPNVPLDSEQEIELADKQIRVLSLMEKHYRTLLEQSGGTLEDLVRGAYGSSGTYRYYINKLVEAEEGINRHLRQNFHTSEESGAVMRRIEERMAEMREEELRFFFQGEAV
ncbi:NF038143 family protein [Desulfonatronum thioautotrophicum]|uniref:NF038143 family protein n=1 Tax=Desulfonatronum thioautotrophicum TaxID=617001 RepID=UPI0005EBB70B|nr:NF038143 family protein [Desulfonatronum thioautotrophicum]